MKNNQMTVFLVDDSEVALHSLAAELERSLHCNVRAFTTAEECLMNLDKNPDLVLADYFLDADYARRMNGDQLLSKIKKENPKLPVIMYSSSNSAEVIKRLMRLGASGFVPKEKNFLHTVRAAVGRQLRKLKTEYADSIARREIAAICVLFIAAVFLLRWLMPEALPYFMIALYAVGLVWLFFDSWKSSRPRSNKHYDHHAT